MFVLNYVKDFKNNKETVLWKEKHGEIRGIATVELFEHGKKVLEAKTENIITSDGYAFFKRAMQTRMVSGTYFSLSDFVNPFQAIYLYNINTPETDEAFPDIGDHVLVGYSNVNTYSGSDPLRGTLNTSESFVSDNKFHFVFDWPTHAANGTFRTILFANPPPIQIYTAASFASPDTDPRDLAWDGQYLWLVGSSADKIYKLTTTGTVVASFASPDSIPCGLAWDGQYLWLVVISTDKIFKLTTTGTVVASFASPDANPYGLAWDGQYLWLAGDNTDKIYKLRLYYGARTLLPAPITKTSMQTMKIQYDFIFTD